MNLQTERTVVERLLQGGMIMSTVLFLAGMLTAIAHGELSPRSVPLYAIASSARHGEVGEAVAAAGVLVLAATPVLRVLALAYLWAREKDFRFVSVALLVAAILVFAVLSGTG